MHAVEEGGPNWIVGRGIGWESFIEELISEWGFED